jgi:hypothetical protein
VPKRTKGTTPIWAFRGGSKYYGYKGGRGLDDTGRYNEARKPVLFLFLFRWIYQIS